MKSTLSIQNKIKETQELLKTLEQELIDNTPKMGDRFIHRDSGEYIFARVDAATYALINLSDGNRWSDPTTFDNVCEQLVNGDFSKVNTLTRSDIINLINSATTKIDAIKKLRDFTQGRVLTVIKLFPKVSMGVDVSYKGFTDEYLSLGDSKRLVEFTGRL